MILHRYLCMLLPSFGFAVNPCSAGVTAEQVLGEYWKDPLFGAAAAEISINVDILPDHLWPKTITVPANKTIRFVFVNKSKEPRLIAFSDDVNTLLADSEFTQFVKDEMLHSEKKVVAGEGHSHSHGSSSADDAKSIVKTLAQRPTVFVVPDDLKEILVRFDEPASIKMFCAIDAHHANGFLVTVEVVKPNE